jgi:hypothetical protein
LTPAKQRNAEDALVTYDSDFSRRAILHDVQERNDGCGVEIDESQWGAGFIEDVTEPQRYQFQMGGDAVVVAHRQGIEQMILMRTRAIRRSDVSPVLQNSLQGEKGDYVLSTTQGEKPIHGIAKFYQTRLPRAILEKNGAALRAPFTSHDLRRSAVTHIAESLGIGGEPLIKRLLGHTDGSVTAIYSRYGYLREIRAAIEAWQIAQFVHAQMQAHYFEEVSGYETKISKGYTDLKASAYTHSVGEPPADYRVSPDDKSNMTKYLFGGFRRCLYPVQKFASDAERKLAIILERDALKWFKPARGQFHMYYRLGADHLEYQPDFVAETAEFICMLEPKMRTEMLDSSVLAKKEVAVTWCANATAYAAIHRGKSWYYVLIPHDAIAENMTLDGEISIVSGKSTRIHSRK